MHYSIFDTGTLLASYNNEADAMNTLAMLAGADPAHSGELVFLAFDDEGERVGVPVLGSYLCFE